MVKVKIGEHEFYIDGYLQSNLDIAKESIKKDWDMLFIIDGMEGAGKSVLGLQCCKYLDPNFNIGSIAFTPTQFIEKIKAAKKHDAVLYDEAYAGLSSRATLSATNKVLVSMLSEIRQKNLFVVIIQPCFFELDKYVSLWRGRALLHVYTTEKLRRGQYAFFNYDKKKRLWMEGKKYFTYSKPPADFVGTFTNYYPVDETLYRSEKHKALMSKDKLRRITRDDVHKKNLIKAIRILTEDFNLSQREVGERLGKSREWVTTLLNEDI